MDVAQQIVIVGVLGSASTPAPPVGTTGQPIGLLLILTKAA